MVDIAMCNRNDCNKRSHCFRYLADANEYWQSYLVIDKMNCENGCENYWQCRNRKELAYFNRVNR